MYLPDKLLAFALVLLSGGIASILFAIMKAELWMLIIAAISIVLGFFALLC